MAVGEVDPPRDAVKVGFGDDLYELFNASLRVDVLDVGLVLGERFNNLRTRYSEFFVLKAFNLMIIVFRVHATNLTKDDK